MNKDISKAVLSAFMEIKKNKIITRLLVYVIIFLLFLGYSVATSSTIITKFIFEKSNLSIYGFGDLFFTIFGQNTIIVLILIIFLLNFESHIETNLSLRRLLLIEIFNAAVCLIIIYASVLIAYIITCDINSFNLGFSDRSAMKFILPSHWAILLSFIFSLFYLVSLSLITLIIENHTRKSWLSVLISITIAYIDVSFRFGFRSKEFIGVLLSDNASVFFLDNIFNNISRPPYINSIIYWIVLISILTSIWLLQNKKRLRVIINDKI